MTNIEIALYVLFGIFAGGPIWLLLLHAWGEREYMRRQRWRVVDSVCRRLGVKP